MYKKNSTPKIKTNLLLYSIILSLIWAFQLLNIYNFISNDFSYNTVYNYSNKSIHWVYKITSSFSNKTGAFLLWLTCIASAGFAFTRKINKIFAQSQFIHLLQAVSILFPLLLSTMLFFTDAFAQTAATTPTDGIGFKPILYSKYNLFHAPLLFAGFAVFYHNYVIAICSLFSRNDITTSLKPLQKAGAQSRAQSGSLRLLCHYNKLGLLLLFCGTLLGSLWAYNSFGWGGFWSWDPIENAVLIPLLLSLALLFAFDLFRLEPSRRLFKLILLIPLITFPMLLLCTFLARGGASLAATIQSVHSYAETNHVELLFILGLLLLVLICSVVVFIIKFRKSANISFPCTLPSWPPLYRYFGPNEPQIPAVNDKGKEQQVMTYMTGDCKHGYQPFPASQQEVGAMAGKWTIERQRKTIALLGIATLFGMAFVVLVGTCLPLFAGLVGNGGTTLLSDFYLMWCRPLVSIFLILSSIKEPRALHCATAFCSDFKWQIYHSENSQISQILSTPTGKASSQWIVCGCALLATVFASFHGISQLCDLLLIFACSLAFASHLLTEVASQTHTLEHKSQRTCAQSGGVPPRGSLLHIGIAVFAAAALLQSHYTTEEKIILIENQKLEIEPKAACILTKVEEEKLPNSNIKVTAGISVFVQDAELALKPHFIVSKANIISHHFPDYARSGITDIYIQPLACYENSGGSAVLVANIITKPFMVFVWLGGGIILVAVGCYPIQYGINWINLRDC